MTSVNILGISAFYHDSAACLVRDGQVVAAAQEERFSRLKHDARFPEAAIHYCMEEGGINPDALTLVVFNEKPFLHFERLLETYLAYAPRGVRQFALSMPVWLKVKLWLKDIIKKETGFTGKILFPSHHESHAAAAFFPSPFPEAAILTMDAVGEWATTAYGIGKNNRLSLHRQLNFPHSLGMLYSAFTYFTGFTVNSDEYKVMGLAPYGEPRYRDVILSEIVDLRKDGSFRLNMEYFDYCAGLTMTSRKFDQRFGASPRKPGSDIREIDMDLASSIQVVTEEIIFRIARYVREQTRQEYLTMSGGVALNSVANGKLLRENIFKDIWIQPAAGDAGSTMGAALYGWHQYLGHVRKNRGRSDTMLGALLGPEYTEEQIHDSLDRMGASYRKMSESDLLDYVSDRISDGQVVGWFQGRTEFGPRALGARSILADARRPEMQQLLNHEVKFREGFRPFAPSVLDSRAGDYFDITTKSPYMLMVFPVKNEHLHTLDNKDYALTGLNRSSVVRSDIPAVTHVDNTARVQTVGVAANPLFRRLLEAFEEKTRCPLLVNTSFNVRGEPIVCSPEDAYRCFMVTGMDVLAIGPFLLVKSDQEPLSDSASIPAAEMDKLDTITKQLRTFGLSTGAGIIVMSMVLGWKFSFNSWWIVSIAGAATAGFGLLFPRGLLSFHSIWKGFTGILGKWIGIFALGVSYYVILLPTALVARLIGRRSLELDADPDRATYWEAGSNCDHVTIERQY